MSVLTTFRVTNKEVTETAFERALLLGALMQPYYVLSQFMQDIIQDVGADILLIFSYPTMQAMEHAARENMMSSIGTSILLLKENYWIENVGLVHHTVGLTRIGGELMWKPMDIYWMDGDRCPFQIKN